MSKKTQQIIKTNEHPQRGSEWQKWDLHVHTPASATDHRLGDNWDNYVDKLIDAIKKHNISAIATADYFTISGYKKLLDYYDTDNHVLSVNDKEAPVYIIPGIELRLNNFNSEEESINIHILFDPEFCSHGFIESNFLEKLRIAYRGGEYDLKRQNILAIGKGIAESSNINVGQDFSKIGEEKEKEYTKKALGAITLNKKDISDALEDIDKIFKNQKLPNKSYLLCVVGKGHGGIQDLKWFEDNKKFSRAGLLREDITHQADIIFSNNKDDIDFYLGKKDDTPPEEVEARFDNLKPCVWGSDSDSIENLLHPSNGNTDDYTWIKGEVTFEGLKQITYEPKLRVKIQKDNPKESQTYARIGSCFINFPDDLKIQDGDSNEESNFCIKGENEIHFSDNLTCIIGGRGSGKSSLIHLLYNAWEKKDSQRLYDVDSPLTNLKLSPDPLSKINELVDVDVPINTEFFLQNEIEKFAKDISKMSELIRHRLNRLSSINIDEEGSEKEQKQNLYQLKEKWDSSSSEIDDLIDAHDNIISLDQKINGIKKEIKTLKAQTEVIKSEKYKTLQKEIEDIATAISDFTNYKNEYIQLIKELNSVIKNISRLDWNNYEGQSVLDELTQSIKDHKTKLKESFEKAESEYKKKKYRDNLQTKKEELKNYLEEKGLSPENIEELADATEQINELENQIKILQSQKEPYEEIYKRKDTILKNYKSDYEDYKDRFFEVAGTLQKSLEGLKFSKSKHEITFHPKINENILKDQIVDFIKNNNTSKTSLSADNIKSVIFSNSKISDFVDDKNRIVEAVNEPQKAPLHTKVLKELLNDANFTESLHLRIIKYYFDINNIQIQTKLGDKPLQNTSFGERCGIVIGIVLVAGTNPIVIDQPEDNLDGKFISNVLVPLLRKQKHHRQIILITRDANIVIGGDSELIEILEEDDDKTILIPSTIENKSNRSKYIWILDGGEQAFQQREKKYCL